MERMVLLLLIGLAGLAAFAVCEFWAGESARCEQEEARRERWRARVAEEGERERQSARGAGA